MKYKASERRKFLKQILIGGGSLCLLPSTSSFLFGCSKDDDDDNGYVEPPTPSGDPFKGSVAIIGAGASGLAAALELSQKQGIEFSIFEASSTYGGRIRKKTDFADFPIELGAEEVHGVKSSLGKLADRFGGKYANDSDSDDFYVLDGKLFIEKDAESDKDLAHLFDIQEEIEKGEYQGADISIAEFIKQKGVEARVMHIANAILANEFGTSIDRIGLASLNDAQYNFQEVGENALLANVSIYDLITKQYESVLNKIRYNTPIKIVDYSGQKVKLTDHQNNVYEFDRVIVTASIAVLKSGKITFTPMLPEKQQSAIQKLGMDAGMKIVLKFKEKFWYPDLGSLYTDGYVPEYWDTGNGRSDTANILTAFVMGQKAEVLSAMGQNAVQEILKDLDRIYGNNTASKNINDSIIMDWTKEEYIRGAYSYPAIGSKGSIAALNEPVNKKIYFAGEANNLKGHFATVHGAIDSGQYVAQKVAIK